MFLRTTTVVFGALCLAQTVAASGVPTSARRVQGLHSRSLTVIPAACQTGCQPFTPFLAGASCPVTECCSTIFQTGYFECFKCVGVSTNATDFSIAQEYVDVLTTSCISEGFPLTERTFPGQNPARTLATALAPGASAIPVFSSGPPAAPPAAPSGSVVRHSTVLAPSRSAHTGTVTVSHSGVSQISGSTSKTGVSASGASRSTVSGASQSTFSGSFTSSGSQSSATSPPSQSTATISQTLSTPSPTTSTNAAFRSCTGSEVVAVLFALVLLHGWFA